MILELLEEVAGLAADVSLAIQQGWARMESNECRAFFLIVDLPLAAGQCVHLALFI